MNLWVPDYSWLSLLAPVAGSSLAIGPRQSIVTQDAAAQTLGAGASAFLTWNANDLSAGAWTPPAATTAVLFEAIHAGLSNPDGAAKLQVLTLALNIGDGIADLVANAILAMPYTFPAVVQSGLGWNGQIPLPILQPVNGIVSANGPVAHAALVNTDGAAAHTYQRYLKYIFRYIYNVDAARGRAFIH